MGRRRTADAPGVKRDPQGPARTIHGATPVVKKATQASNPPLVRSAGGRVSSKGGR